MKKWIASKNVSGLCLIGLLWLGANQPGFGQCPIPEEVTIQMSSSNTFAQKQGEITFLFESSTSQFSTSYRIRLYDVNEGQYVYDDNNPPFLNHVPAPITRGKQLVFTNLPKGDYELELHGQSCQHQRYQVDSKN